MKIKGDISLADIRNLIPEETTCYLATSYQGQPGVRMMGLNMKEKQLWVLTFSDRQKVAEINANSQIAICIPLKGENRLGQIRGKGLAILIDDPAIKARIANQVSWFSNYFEGVSDPQFILYRLDISRYLVQHPENGKYFLWEQNH